MYAAPIHYVTMVSGTMGCRHAVVQAAGPPVRFIIRRYLIIVHMHDIMRLGLEAGHGDL
jgi:hypothetical protein